MKNISIVLLLLSFVSFGVFATHGRQQWEDIIVDNAICSDVMSKENEPIASYKFRDISNRAYDDYVVYMTTFNDRYTKKIKNVDMDSDSVGHLYETIHISPYSMDILLSHAEVKEESMGRYEILLWCYRQADRRRILTE